MSTATSPLTNIAIFSLDHYEHMVECGAFGNEYETKHVELIQGKILERGTGIPAKFTFEHYEHMIAVGAFDPPYDIPVELLNGEIVMMSPIGPSHRHYLRLLTDWSYEVVPTDQIAIHVQAPIRMPKDSSEPEPDLVWTVEKDFSQRHPEPEQVLLLVEVADSSLSYDRKVKLPHYALAGIPEYWIVNLIDEQIEVYRDPIGGAYQKRSVHRGDGTISPLALPEATLATSHLFGD